MVPLPTLLVVLSWMTLSPCQKGKFVVNDRIIWYRCFRYDFFLVSQSVRQGTVNPTSYNVIKDTSGLKPDHLQVKFLFLPHKIILVLQKLTYKLTHLYYNWPGTVRVPAPCQYAHKLAFLVGESLHRQPSEQLEEVLYFLWREQVYYRDTTGYCRILQKPRSLACM